MICKNCGTEGSGRFCANCGQKLDTQPFTLRRILQTALASITEIDKGFLYNLKYLTIDFRDTVLGYLDGKRIRVYNPMSYVLIGLTLLLLADDYFGATINVETIEWNVNETDYYGFGFQYGKFASGNIKYIWLLGILCWAIPAAIFYRKRKFTEHLIIQAFVIGHACFLTTLFYPIMDLQMPFNPVLLGMMLVLNAWVFWKMDRELNSLLFAPLILLLGQILLVLIPVPFFYVYQKIKDRPLPREVVIDDLSDPWGMAFLDANEVLVTEKAGRLLRIDLETGDRNPIQGLPVDIVRNIGEVDSLDQAGLFEVLIDPEYPAIDWVYLSYAAQADDGRTTTKVIRGHLRGDRLSELETLLEVEPYAEDRVHYGGGMTFDRNGHLLISVGDRFYDETDQPTLPVAQNPRDARGMIYRINKDGTIPESNPDLGPEASPGAYAMGIRATQGFALNPKNEDVWFTDHGARGGDEVNRLQAGANYGWPVKTTGRYQNEEYQPPQLADSSYTKPVFRWVRTVAPAGMHFYEGDRIKRLEDQLLVAGLAEGSLWAFTLTGKKIFFTKNLFRKNPLRLRQVTQGPDEVLYVLTDGPDGKILKIGR